MTLADILQEHVQKTPNNKIKVDARCMPFHEKANIWYSGQNPNPSGIAHVRTTYSLGFIIQYKFPNCNSY